jgi:hypothetical protein
MKNFNIFIPCLFFMTACGTSRDIEIDSRLNSLITQWETDCQNTAKRKDKCTTKGLDSVTIVEDYGTEENVIGRCITEWKGIRLRKYITFKREIIENAEPFTKRALVLHEFLHCQFSFYAHTSKGIMQSTMLTEDELKTNWDKLLKEAYQEVE